VNLSPQGDFLKGGRIMLKQITTGIALASVLALPALAAPQRMTTAQLDNVVAGTGTDCGCPPPTGKEKGNNGWGNGEDPTNPGSFNGKTEPSKSTNGSVSGAGRPNTNPTGSTGR
jgi:hypothetical protein